MFKKYKIAILPGDGIGPEVIKQVYKIIYIINKIFNLNIITKEYKIGGIAIDNIDNSLPLNTLLGCLNSNAILLGSVGGNKWNNLPLKNKPEIKSLLFLRKYFKLFNNLRPSKLYSGLEDLCPLKKEIYIKGLNILCVRELISGIYFGKPKGNNGYKKLEYSFDTEIYYKFEIEKIAHIAFKKALERKCKLTLVDKSNVLESSMLWKKTVSDISKLYPKVNFNHMYIDNITMQLIKNPSQFDVILCSNLFGDIISDECAMISGSIGMLPSASLNDNNFGIYEPAGGSAPDIAGKNISNPIAQILSFSMLLRYSFNLIKESNIIENSINNILKFGYKTKDLKLNSEKFINTSEMGSLISCFIIKEKLNEQDII
ncbi:3-isopropylmalate dehydrogenase [Candidatus Annandia adelgestsuga]|uniref:3-isopropylmalate dehydrogenase n=1 Tax=Candidatus Annandia adelgestsuga TaxID=1302411 RepID=A0A3S9J7G5_9ENTR|nr:3-isopropylmalate dehydrogenase [Candidatus Annandia adelgestsuga]AZP36243.1 3-isopropylmalate dehydrogenase [Candidatus Annandia adelgestsuga]